MVAQIRGPRGEALGVHRTYGTPGRAFVAAIARNLISFRDLVAELRRNFADSVIPTGADGQVKRVADRFALVAAAGEIATDLEITGWDPGDAQYAVARCFRDWLSERGGIGSGEVAEARRRIADALEQYGQSRFQKWHKNADRAVITPRWGFVKVEEDDGSPLEDFVFYFIAGTLRDLLAGLDFQYVVAELIREGVLIDQNGKPNKVFNVPNAGGRHRLYQIGPNALAGSQICEADA